MPSISQILAWYLSLPVRFVAAIYLDIRDRRTLRRTWGRKPTAKEIRAWRTLQRARAAEET